MRINPISFTPFNGTLDIYVKDSKTSSGKPYTYSVRPLDTNDILEISKSEIMTSDGHRYVGLSNPELKSTPQRMDLFDAFVAANEYDFSSASYNGDVFEDVSIPKFEN